MRKKINEDVICVLRKNKLTNQIEIDYITIEKPLANIIDKFKALCDDPNVSLRQIVSFIERTTELNQLTNNYSYCVSLSGSYQSFNADNRTIIDEIFKREQLILSNQKNDPEKYDKEKAISYYKLSLKNEYILWNDAFSINQTYRKCQEDDSILTFSHRINGWSNPVYQLTTNFSIEIKTNFGYGNVSYFYTKLKYKNIEITPFSDWVNYEFAKFSEIIRYTRRYYSLKNEDWFDAMKFSRDACNLSMNDEVKFVSEYILDECEKMVLGLEEIFRRERFIFKNLHNKVEYIAHKTGNDLIEIRGEKISGALDFISKILEFENIASIRTFINRIENCNKKIQPILNEESNRIKFDISILINERNYLKPSYDKVIKIDNDYKNKKIVLQKQMTINGLLINENDAKKILEIEFNNLYPEYCDFEIEFRNTTNKFKNLNREIQTLTNCYNNILKYKERIIKYFGS